MMLPQLLRAIWPLIIGGLVLGVVAVILGTVFIPWFGVFKGRPLLRWLVYLAPLAYPLACWALFSWAAGHDRRIEEHLRTSGVAARATVTTVRDLGIDVNVNPLLTLDLRVTPPDAQPFDAEVSVNPSRLQMHLFQPGSTVRVRYDPRDPSRLALVE